MHQQQVRKATVRKFIKPTCCVVVGFLASIYASNGLAAPTAVDDSVTTPSNTAIVAEDLSANDTVLSTDVYSISTPPQHGTASLTSNGFLDYTPNIGFASTDTLIYTVEDGAGGSATATVTVNVDLSSDFLSPAATFIIGQEDVPVPLDLVVDPSLEFGGTLQDVIGVSALFRANNAGNTAVSATIPAGTTSINVTGYATRNAGTSNQDDFNDDHQIMVSRINLREATYSGQLTYSVSPSTGNHNQFSWLDAPLGQSVLTDTSFVSGGWTGDSDPTISLVNGQIQISETIPLQVAYHIEFLTADGDSANFISTFGAVQNPGDTTSSFVLPPELEPAGTAKKGYVVLTGNGATNGANFNEEHKGISRIIVDLGSGTVSGVIASERGETDARVTTWAFTDYPLVDLRATPGATTSSIQSSTANIVGDASATVAGVNNDPTIYIDAAGDLIVDRAAGHAAAFTTMYTSEYYERTELSSIATFVGVVSDNTLFDSTPPDGVDDNGKPVNIQTFDVPESSSIGLVQMSWQTIGGTATNENIGIGFAVIDLANNSSSGSITFSRTTTPDLVSWQGVPLGTTMFGATAGGVPLFQSNKAPGDFTDQYPETARFTLVANPDGSQTLEFTATSNAGTGAFADYIGQAQVSWLGSEPFSVQGVPVAGQLSHGSPIAGGNWEVDFSDLENLTISAGPHQTGELQLNLALDSTGELDTIIIQVEPVLDPPSLSATDVFGYINNATSTSISATDSVDVDGSETHLQLLNLSGIPTSVTLSSSAGTVTNFGGGSWQVDQAALATLTAIGPSATTATVTVSGTSTDTDDLDGDSVIEDFNNGNGVDELDTATFTDTFQLTIVELPTVVSQTAFSDTPIISGTANAGPNETLTVTVNGITYTAGDGNLVDNGNGTWDLTIPSANSIPDGTYAVTASLTHASGSVGTDIATDELIIDTSAPVVPTVIAQATSDTTPIISGTATVALGETLIVSVNGVAYTAGDGNLTDNGDGTWDLSVPMVLAEATYSVTASVSDMAGNVSMDISINELTVDITIPAAPGVTSQTTSDTTPIIVGTATIAAGEILTVEVNGVTYTAGDGNLIDNADGTWALTIPTSDTLPLGLYQVNATITDAAGNAAFDPGVDELLILAPLSISPGVTSLTTDDSTPRIEGNVTVPPSGSFSVTVNAITYVVGDGNLMVNIDDTWVLNIPATDALQNGLYDVTATVIDTLGNDHIDASNGELLVTINPSTPTVIPLNTNIVTPTLSGTASTGPSDTLTIIVDGVTYTAGDGNLVDNGNGTWDLTIPTALAEGTYDVTTTVINAASHTFTDTSDGELIIDLTLPVVPTVNSLITNNTTPTITGTATVAPGEVLTVTLNGVTYIVGDGNLIDHGDGTWELSIPTALAENIYDVVATVTDLASNSSSDVSTNELTIDLTAPTIPSVTSLITNNNTPVVSGMAVVNPGEILTIMVSGVTYTAGDGNLVDNGDGTWDLTLPTTHVDGSYEVATTVTDAAGNISNDITASELTIDTVVPVQPTVTPLYTNDSTPTISGTGVVGAGEILSVVVNGVVYTEGDGNLTVNGDGTWTLSIPTALADGVFEVSANITDTAGNSVDDITVDELTVDTAPPTKPTVIAQSTMDSTPIVTGSATLLTGEVLTVSVNGVTYTAGDGMLVDNGNGTWSLTIPNTNALADNNYEVIATITDPANNAASDTTNFELTVDSIAPIAPTVTALNTNVPTPTIAGTATVAAGETLSVTVNGVTYTAGDGNLTDNGDGTWNLVIPTNLAEGDYNVTATVIDSAGNSSIDATANELTIDLTPASAPGVTSQVTTNTTPTIEGVAMIGPGETLTVEVNGIVYTAGDGNLTLNADDTWILNIPATNVLPENLYQIIATITDSAGNTSVDPGVDDLLVDTTAPAAPGVTSLTTNDTTPTIVGTAIVGAGETLTVSVNGVTYTAGDGNLVDNANGTWGLTIPVSDILPEALYDVTATTTDLVGFISTDPSSGELLVDITPPIVPTVIAQVTNNNTPVISGTASIGVGETLTVTVDGITYMAGDGSLVDNADGTWDLFISTPLNEATYEVVATLTDAAGNQTSDTGTADLIIDITPPPVPAVTSQTTSNNFPVISGTANVGLQELLSVTVDGVIYTAGDGNLIDNGDGTWDLTVPTSLPEANYEIIASITDPAGNVSNDVDTNELVIDNTPPATPTVIAQTTNDNTPIIFGTATVTTDDTLIVVVDGVTYTVGDGNLVDNGDGTWDLSIPTALIDGTYDVSVSVTDSAGNSSMDTTISELIIDTATPALPTVTALITNNTTPILSGTAIISIGEALTVSVNGVTYTVGDGNLVDNGDGTWDLNLPNTNSLTDGTYEVVATVSDSAGNASTDAANADLIVDTVAPAVPTITTLITNNNSPIVQGSAVIASGETLNVTVNGITYTAGDGHLVDNDDGTWDLSIPTGNALPDNTYEVIATVTDVASNTASDTSALELTIDTVAPATPTVLPQLTNNTTPIISGTATVAPGEELSVTVDGVIYSAGNGNLVDNGDGTWNLTIPTPLIQGTYDVIATVTDAAGNITNDATVGELVIDTTAPVNPTVISQTTVNNLPVISGTATVSPGDTLTVIVDGVTYTAGDGNLVDNGDTTWDLTVTTALPEANYEIVATVTDLAGNSANDTDMNELIIDNTPPAVPTVTSLITNNTSPVVSGTATVGPNETLEVIVNGVTYVAGDGSLVDNGDGTWNLTLPTPLPEGSYDISATVTDAAGNTSSDASADELVIDITPPAAPGVTSQTTANTNPVIQGTATIGVDETLSVDVNGITYVVGDSNLIDNGNGTWTLTIPVANTLPEALYQVVANVTDLAGNSTIDPGIDDLLIDTTAPSSPGITSLTTNDTTPVISGAAIVGQGETLTVEVNGITYIAGDGSLVDNGDGTWDLTIPSSDALAESVYDVTATITDAAGNTSSDPSTDELLVDTTAPGTPTVSPQITNNTTPTISGTANAGPGETLSVTVAGVTYTAGDGNLVDNGDGTWDLTIPTPLAEAVYEVVVTVTDAAGNSTADATVSELVIDITSPAAPTVQSQNTNDTTPVISGTATVTLGDILTVTVDGGTYTAGDGNLIDNGDGTWDLTLPTALVEGSYDVVATIIDAAANITSDTTVGELVIDTTAPASPMVISQTTLNNLPVISGTATINPGEILTVIVDGVAYTAGDGNLVDNGDGTWDLTVPTALAEASYEVLATVTDLAGNFADDTDMNELIIDNTPPAVPTVIALTTNNDTPVVSGTAAVGAGETLTVTVNGTTYTTGDGNLVDNGDGTWDLMLPTPLAEGIYDITATITDVAGNTSADLTVDELTIDTTPPTAPSVTSLITAITTPIINGTATTTSDDTLTVAINGITYNAHDGNLVDNGDGTWTLNIPAIHALPEATYQVVAIVTDAAGNSASDPGLDDLLVDTSAPTAPGVTSLTTNDTTPVISGTASVGPNEILTVEVNGIIYTAGDGDLVDNGDGTWDLSIPASDALAEGVYDVTATITDAAGNTTTNASTNELLIDTTAPTLPTVGPQITNNTTPTISGTANAGPGDVLTVTVDGVTYISGDGNLIDNGDGTWDLTIPTPLAEGNYEVVLMVTDAAGNSISDATSNELVIDVTLPVAPAVMSQTTLNNLPIISGTATVIQDDILTVTVDGITYVAGDGNLVDNGDGTWDLTVPTPLPEANYEVVATVTDMAGNASSDTNMNELIIDNTAPATPTGQSLATNNTSPVISGTAIVGPGETLTVTVNGVTYTAGDGNLFDNGDGTWNLSIPTPLAEGNYPVIVTVADTAGNSTSNATPVELLIDITPPIAPGVTSQTTSNTTPIISGTATLDIGETLSVKVNGVNYTTNGGNLIDNGDGTWVLIIPTLNTLPEALYQVVATIADTAGNSTIDPGVDDLLVDTTTPTSPGVTSLTTNNTTPVISGTAIVGSSEILTVEVNGVTYTAGDGNLIDNSDGTWDLTIPTSDTLAEGVYDVVATVTDVAGNTSTDSSTNELLVDTTAPTTPTVSPRITNDTTPTISGTANAGPGETLSVTVDGVTYIAGDGNLVDNGDGTWSLTIPTPLSEGSYEVVATVTDAAGNTISDTNTGELNIDTTAPTTPTVTSQTTMNNLPIISGTATINPGEVFTVMVDGITYIAGDGNLVINGDGTWDLTVPSAIPEANYEVVATVFDMAGNSTADANTNELIIDNTPPTAPTVTALLTNDNTPVLSGTANVGPGETLSVTVNGVTYTAGDGNLVINGNGTWDLTVPTSLTDGEYDVTATITDIAGNIASDTGNNELTIDTTAPAVPTVTSILTNDNRPEIFGTATVSPDETLTVEVNGVTYTAGDGNLVDNGDGTWQLSLPTAHSEGTYSITATVTDGAGNTSVDSSSDELEIDNTAPITPTVTALSTNDTMPTITGTAVIEPGDTFTVTVDGVTYTVGDGNLRIDSNGVWTLTLPTPLTQGSYNIVATVTDAAGNSSSDTSLNELTIDSTAPTPPTANVLVTSDNTPLISGTADVGLGDTLRVRVDGVTYTAGNGNLVDNGNGTWRLQLATSLFEGGYDVMVSVIDNAGNITTEITSGELTIDTIAPAIPTVTAQNTTDPTPTIEGTAVLSSGEALVVAVNGVNYTTADGNLVVNSDGTWTLNITEALPEGSYSVTATVTDQAGNASIDNSVQELVIELEPDFDADGIPNIDDLDSDNDGIPDTVEGTQDADRDGLPNYLDLDSDNDGIADIVEMFGDDLNNDYRVDNIVDNDNNGLSDDLQVLPLAIVDTDLDSVPDYLDLDSDNDGISDALESGSNDLDHNGATDGFADQNVDGADDAQQLLPPAGLDTDGDGIPNRLDPDTDNDGLLDSIESGSLDTNEDGVVDTMQDADFDGIPNSVDVDLTGGVDVDNDGIDDQFDASFAQALDSDDDGIIDSADPDANGDGFADDPHSTLAQGEAFPDVNANGIADILEPHEDIALAAANEDVFVITGIKGNGCSVAWPNVSKGPRDPLFPILIMSALLIGWRRKRAA